MHIQRRAAFDRGSVYPALAWIGLCLSCFGLGQVNAAQESVMMGGVLIAPPLCKVNDDEVLSVDFERINIEKIDGIQYRKKLEYQIGCEKVPENHGGVFRLTLSGNAASFSPTRSAILSNVSQLAIQVYQNDQPFVLGVPIQISLNNIPVLEAVPIKAEGATLQERPFEATATLQVDYQ